MKNQKWYLILLTSNNSLSSFLKVLPDGNADFTRLMGLLVAKRNLCFGMRSQRYSMHVVNRKIEKMFIEGPVNDNFPTDPFFVSDAGTMLGYLRGN